MGQLALERVALSNELRKSAHPTAQLALERVALAKSCDPAHPTAQLALERVGSNTFLCVRHRRGRNRGDRARNPVATTRQVPRLISLVLTTSAWPKPLCGEQDARQGRAPRPHFRASAS